MKDYRLPCPSCGKERKFATQAYFCRAKKYNKTCKACSNSLKAGGLGYVMYDEQGNRCCIDCKEFKSLDEYYKTKTGILSTCIKCSHIRNSKYHKAYYKYAKYGIDKTLHDEMLANQNGKCAICTRELSLQKEVHIDHCHTTGKVRGILCGKCNKGLGQFEDNVEYLNNAIKYLKK